MKSFFGRASIIYALVGTLGLAILATKFYSHQGGASASSQATISEGSSAIFTDETALRTYMTEFGVKKTIVHLNELSQTMGSCHNQAHKAGRLAYELHGDESFRLCSAECHSGCYHGATEAYFREHGTKNLSENLNILCGNELNSFFSHQCIHGIGHGLMAWTNYELFDALENCNLLTERRDSCWTGVFMENYVGGLAGDGHTSRFLNNDPLYPCTIVDDQYKSSCYFLQTSRMIQIFGADFRKVADACLKAPEAYHASCFASMGRDVGGVNHENPKGAIAACMHAPQGALRIECLNGAVQDSFWDPTGQDAALEFCRELTIAEEKRACYATIFERAPTVLATKNDLQVFCRKAEPDYEQSCLTSGGL